MVGKQKCHPEQSRCVFCTCGGEAGVPGDRSSSLGREGPVVVCFSFAQPLTVLNSELICRLYMCLEDRFLPTARSAHSGQNFSNIANNYPQTCHTVPMSKNCANQRRLRESNHAVSR